MTIKANNFLVVINIVSILLVLKPTYVLSNGLIFPSEPENPRTYKECFDLDSAYWKNLLKPLYEKNKNCQDDFSLISVELSECAGHTGKTLVFEGCIKYKREKCLIENERKSAVEQCRKIVKEHEATRKLLRSTGSITMTEEEEHACSRAHLDDWQLPPVNTPLEVIKTILENNVARPESNLKGAAKIIEMVSDHGPWIESIGKSRIKRLSPSEANKALGEVRAVTDALSEKFKRNKQSISDVKTNFESIAADRPFTKKESAVLAEEINRFSRENRCIKFRKDRLNRIKPLLLKRGKDPIEAGF